MDQDRLARQMAFIVEADKVKSVFRQNTLADASRRENDAEHMWHFALMAVVLANTPPTRGGRLQGRQNGVDPRSGRNRCRRHVRL
jgi:5'-deoxynucleotidase YfbR-like HD superfamily hydrolase